MKEITGTGIFVVKWKLITKLISFKLKSFGQLCFQFYDFVDSYARGTCIILVVVSSEKVPVTYRTAMAGGFF